MRVKFALRDDQTPLYQYMREAIIHRVEELEKGSLSYLTKNDITYAQGDSVIMVHYYPHTNTGYLQYTGPRDGEGDGIYSIAYDLLAELFPSTQFFHDPIQYETDISEQEYNSIRWSDSTIGYMEHRACTRERLAVILTYILQRNNKLAKIYELCINKLGPENTRRITEITKLYNTADLTITTLDPNEPSKGTPECYRNTGPLDHPLEQKSILEQLRPRSVDEQLASYRRP